VIFAIKGTSQILKLQGTIAASALLLWRVTYSRSPDTGSFAADDAQTVQGSIADTTLTSILTGQASKILFVQRIFIRNDHASSQNTVTLSFDDGTARKELVVTLNAQEYAICDDSGKWVVYSATGAMYATAPITQKDVYGTVGSFTYTKPAGARTIRAVAIGAGGGGASGRSTATAAGGGGGGGGGRADESFIASEIGATLAVVVGAKGTGGASLAAGNPGNNGADSTLADTDHASFIILRAGGGFGGTVASGASTGGAGGPIENANNPAQGANPGQGFEGGAQTASGLSTTGGNAAHSGGGGGAQGGSTATGTTGGKSSRGGGGGGGGGTTGTCAGGAGGGAASPATTQGAAGINSNYTTEGGSGGSGGGTTTTTGGNGGSPGGGGGGGGSVANGAGGNGADGSVVIYTWF
jgi:hypothetical protein